MAKNWTENQKNAIDARGGSILVSAAAGSGKTAVLVQRIIELITDKNNPVDVDKLLVVTFTRAAATEMKNRVKNAIDELYSKNPYDRNLIRQKQLMYKASICTIDSFCIDLSREFFYKLNIKRDFRIADSSELKLLESDVMDNTLEYFYQENNDDFLKLVDAFSSTRDDEQLRKIISFVYTFLRSHPYPEYWLKNKLYMYDIKDDIWNSLWGEIIIEYTMSALDYCKSIAFNECQYIKEIPELASEKCCEVFNDIYAQLESISFSDSHWDSISTYINNFCIMRLTFPKKNIEDETKQHIKNSRDNIKKVMDSLKKLFVWTEEECINDIGVLKPIVTTLFEIIEYYISNMEQVKRQKNIADFADTEHFVVKLVTKNISSDIANVELSEDAFNISKRFDQIMVDEFQDINEAQNFIFRAISKSESNLFMVGDVKQSIYGFRQAMPSLFLERKNSYAMYKPQNSDFPAKIILDKNFRSRKGIADMVNFVFSHLMSKSVGDMDYTEEEVLYAGAKYDTATEPEICLSLIERKDYEKDMSIHLLEARYIAYHIHRMVMSGYLVMDDGKKRPAQYGDFAILLRSTSHTSNIYVNELVRLGIPAFSETKDSFFSAKEVQIMINLLKIIDNPLQDIPLLSVMMSPIFGFTADELAKIRCDSKKVSLYYSVLNSNLDKAKKFISLINHFRTVSVTTTVGQLIDNIYDITSYPDVMSAIESRNNVVKNLQLLREYGENYENNGHKGLSAFVSFIDKLQRNGEDLSASSLVDGEVTNTVKVLSIHGSKGLEFPVCFVATMSKKFNKSDLNNNVLLSSDFGIGIKIKENLFCHTTMPREAVALEISRTQISEELRILYVAMTRAREKLYLISSQNDCKGYIENLSAKVSPNGNIPEYSVRSANSYSDWIFMCALCLQNSTKFSSSNVVTQTNNINDSLQKEIEEEYVDLNFLDLSDDANKNGIPINLDLSAFDDNISSDFVNEIDRRINFKYDRQPLVSMLSKVTASELAHKDKRNFKNKIFMKPKFLSYDTLSPTEKGTIFHKFLQYCDFSNLKDDYKQEINRIKSLNILSESELFALDCHKIEMLLASGIVDRIIKSNNVFREYQFMVNIDASMVDDKVDEKYKNEPVLLQGAVDLCFEEDGELVIVDYKTDRIKYLDELSYIYAKQLLLYKNAMEQSTDYKIKECLIYSLYLGEFIKIAI